MNTAKEYLLRYNIKPSQQRLAIMAYLLAYRIHPTAEDVFNALSPDMPTLSRTTVYNTLKLFEAQGVLQTLAIDEKNIRFDIDTFPHAHFKCNCCGKIFDLKVNSVHELDIKQTEQFIITELHLYYKGYCKKCKGCMEENNN